MDPTITRVLLTNLKGAVKEGIEDSKIGWRKILSIKLKEKEIA